MTTIRRATAADAGALAEVAAATFPLACPPHTTDEAKADFIATHLTEAHFDDYLADPRRDLFVAVEDAEGEDGGVVGYTMLVADEPSDPEVVAALTVHPTVELSKVYVLPGLHGAGVSGALVAASVAAARGRGAAAVWLGVNQENGRANRFYEKNGFALVGSKHFLVGGRYEDDYVRELVLETSGV